MEIVAKHVVVTMAVIGQPIASDRNVIPQACVAAAMCRIVPDAGRTVCIVMIVGVVRDVHLAMSAFAKNVITSGGAVGALRRTAMTKLACDSSILVAQTKDAMRYSATNVKSK